MSRRQLTDATRCGEHGSATHHDEKTALGGPSKSGSVGSMAIASSPLGNVPPAEFEAEYAIRSQASAA